MSAAAILAAAIFGAAAGAAVAAVAAARRESAALERGFEAGAETMRRGIDAAAALLAPRGGVDFLTDKGLLSAAEMRVADAGDERAAAAYEAHRSALGKDPVPAPAAAAADMAAALAAADMPL